METDVDPVHVACLSKLIGKSREMKTCFDLEDFAEPSIIQGHPLLCSRLSR